MVQAALYPTSGVHVKQDAHRRASDTAMSCAFIGTVSSERSRIPARSARARVFGWRGDCSDLVGGDDRKFRN
jgi:hypothetical protein